MDISAAHHNEDYEEELTSSDIAGIVVFCLIGLWAAHRSWRLNAIGRISNFQRVLKALGSFFFGVPLLLEEFFARLFDYLLRPFFEGHARHAYTIINSRPGGSGPRAF